MLSCLIVLLNLFRFYKNNPTGVWFILNGVYDKKGLFIVWCLVLQNKKLDTTTTSKLLCKQISNCKRECEQLRSRKIHSSPQFSPSKNFSACLSACPEKVKLVVKSLFLPPGQKSPSHMPGGLALSWAGLKCMIAILQTLTIHSFHFLLTRR